MDALLTQRAIARQILEQHGPYLMVVKPNQPELFRNYVAQFEFFPGLSGQDRFQSPPHQPLEPDDRCVAGSLPWNPYGFQGTRTGSRQTPRCCWPGWMALSSPRCVRWLAKRYPAATAIPALAGPSPLLPGEA
jgi:hypothetical protein